MTAVAVAMPATLLIVPGLRDHVEAHWQTRLAARLPLAHAVPPMGRSDLDCAARVAAIERAASSIDGPLVIVAHSAGCLMVAHWAAQATPATRRVAAALLVAPPDFEQPMPEGYPRLAELAAGGWLPVPRQRLPFRSQVGASRNDPLSRFDRVATLAADWGSTLIDLGEVGHVNPASGHGPWPAGDALIDDLLVTVGG